MTFGLTIKKPEPEIIPSDTFSLPRPIYQTSQDAERLQHTTPPARDNTPAAPVIDSIVTAVQETTGHSNQANKLAELILAAQLKIKQAAEKQTHTIKSKLPKTTLQQINQLVTSQASEQVVTQESDKCANDEEYIKRTRQGDIQSVEMKRLFFANGGQAYLNRGLLYGPAFDMMRREKMAALKKLEIDPNEPMWSRCDKKPEDVKVYVPGLPSQELLMRRAFAKEDAKKRRDNEKWMQAN